MELSQKKQMGATGTPFVSTFALFIYTARFQARYMNLAIASNKLICLLYLQIQWMAPELLRRQGFNSAATDIYSFGIVLYEACSRKVRAAAILLVK